MPEPVDPNAPPAPPADPNAGKWFAGTDADTLAYLNSRGLAEKTAAEAFADAAKAHREAQAYIGVPKDQLLRLPASADDVDGWKAVWQRLGTPDSPDKYDFTPLKPADGDLDPKLVDTLRATAAAANLPAAAALKVAEGVLKFQADSATERAANDTAALDAAKAALKTSWGAAYDSNQVVARNAAAALGVAPEAVAALEKVVGYDKVMELFRVVGTKIGEANFIGGGGPTPAGGGGAFTRETAAARIAELKADTEFSKRYINGGAAERKEMDSLHQIAYSEAQ